MDYGGLIMADLEKCKYRLPCGWCDRKNEKCEMLHKPILEKDIQVREHILEATAYQRLCKHEWIMTNKTTLGNYYRCFKCGATKTQSCG